MTKITEYPIPQLSIKGYSISQGGGGHYHFSSLSTLIFKGYILNEGHKEVSVSFLPPSSCLWDGDSTPGVADQKFGGPSNPCPSMIVG